MPWMFSGHSYSTSHIQKASISPPNLFVAHAGPKKGQVISSQRWLKWIMEMIRLAYLLAKQSLPGPTRAHSTRAMAMSASFLLGVSLEDICTAATWASPHTIMKHYALDVRLRCTALLGRDPGSLFLRPNSTHLQVLFLLVDFLISHRCDA